jgi:Tol biopolymer transport system component
MTLAPGARLGPYEIVAPLGAGGMGEVHRARDTRLGRDVAIKALPAEFAQDPERLARFDREARLLASLSHPNVGAIYGLEDVGGRRYLVLELIEGETLAQRLARGSLAFREALEVCGQVAAALETAHEAGIVHRDLKPGNVMLAAGGGVKVLDFGLAKSGASAAPGSDPAQSASPTRTYVATSAGMVLGTAAYMSPEQARGKGVDKRTDIWSFGCVLFECVTGRQAFQGETVSDLIARILEREPDWSALPASVTPPIRDLLQRCLEKDPRQRLRDIGDARITIERERAKASGPVPAAAGAAGARGGFAPPALIAALVLGAVLGAAGWALLARSPGSLSALGGACLSMPFPDSLEVADGGWSDVSHATFMIASRRSAVGAAKVSRIYVRPLDSFEVRELPGTEGARFGSITADGRWIVFVAPVKPDAAELRLARVPTDGGAPPVTLTPWAPDWRSFALLSNGDAIVADETGGRVFRVPATGGSVEETKIDRGDLRAGITLGRPLPGDHAVFFQAGIYGERGWRMEPGVLDLDRRRLVLLGQEGGNAMLAPGGTLLFSRGEVLLAAPFDRKGYRLLATPVAVASGLWANFSYTPGIYLVDREGTLSFVPGGAVGDERRIGVVDAQGRLRTLAAEPHPYQGWPSVAGDGRTMAVLVTNPQGIDEIWLGDTERATLRRIVSWPSADCSTQWLSRDGRSLAYRRRGRDALDGVYVTDVASGGKGRRVVAPESTGVIYGVEDWTSDGSALILTRSDHGGHQDLWMARLDPARDSVLALRRLAETPDQETAASVSPDGRWLAYQCDQTGRPEVYVAPLRSDGPLGSAIQLTDQGGSVPEWVSPTVLYFRGADQQRVFLMNIGPDPANGDHPVREWLDLEALGVRDLSTMRNGSVAVVLSGPQERAGPRAVRLVLGWSRELRRKMAAGR